MNNQSRLNQILWSKKSVIEKQKLDEAIDQKRLLERKARASFNDEVKDFEKDLQRIYLEQKECLDEELVQIDLIYANKNEIHVNFENDKKNYTESLVEFTDRLSKNRQIWLLEKVKILNK